MQRDAITLLAIKLSFCHIFYICLCELLPDFGAMEVLSKSLWLAIVFCFDILITSGIEFQEPNHEITTESYDFTSYATTELSTQSPNDNGMAIGDVQEEVKPNDSPFREKEDETVDVPETVLITFPDNHRNFTPSQYLGDINYPPYYNYINNYQQQYKNYYEQKQLYNRKPLKFEENSNKNLYLSQGVNSFLEPEEKPDKLRLTKKPFPYEFEKKKLPENWYKLTEHIPVKEEPSKEYYQTEYQEKVPYYVFPHSGPYEQKFYKDEILHHEHHDVMKEEKFKNPWKSVFKYLTALVPLGLLLATLTPNVISINSTASTKTIRQRSEDDTFVKFKEEDVMKLLKEYGVESLNESQCEDRVICELARRGDEATANAIEKGFWYLANETPRDVAEKAGMNDLFKAIKTGNCETFECHTKPKTTAKSTLGKKLIKKRKILAVPPKE